MALVLHYDATPAMMMLERAPMPIHKVYSNFWFSDTQKQSFQIKRQCEVQIGLISTDGV